MATGIQIKLIHTLKGALCLDDDAYRTVLAGYGVQSSTKLSEAKAAQLVQDLEAKALASGVWKSKTKRTGKAWQRPKNMEGHKSRAEQLKKIEALLTVGKKSWAYADALAQAICKVAKVQWVKDDELYKIITALRKQAKREDWDLSGEKQTGEKA